MKRALASCLAACLFLLCLTSCALMLERDYTEATDHVEDQPSLGDTAYRVETYPALRAAMLAYVEEGLSEGFLRCPTTYSGNLSVDLEKARRQLMEEDPLGCYALADVGFQISRIIAYYEVELDFTYQVDAKEVAGLPRMSTREALARALGQGLENWDTRLCFYLTAYPEEDAGFFDEVLEEAYGAYPAALGRPQISCELYPDAGTRRVAVLTLDYGEDLGELQSRREQLDQALDGFWETDTKPDAQGLFERLKARCRLDDQAGSTAYDALVEGRADRDGLTLAYAALCRRWRIDCQVVRSDRGYCAALRTREGETLGYLDLTADRFELLEALPADAGADETTV